MSAPALLLPNNRQAIERLALEAARDHPAWFGEYALGLYPQQFHIDWQDLASAHPLLLLFAPIEHGKSTQLSIVRLIWELGRNPDIRIALISDTETKAKRWVSKVRISIEINERVREVFPHLLPENRSGWGGSWTDEAIDVRRSKKAAFTEADHSLRAFGVGGPLGGSRFDLIVCDDLLDFANTRIPAAREKTWEWYKSPEGPLSRRVKGGRIIDIGTAMHEDDYRHQIEKELPGWHVVRYQAGPNGNCPWPEVWSAERLAAKLAEGELEYARQFLNIPFGEATQYLPIAAIRKCQELSNEPLGYWMGEITRDDLRWCTVGVDIGSSLEAGSARSAIAVLGLGVDGFKRPLHIRSGLWVGMSFLEEVVQVWILFEHVIREMIVESNAQQAHLVGLLQDEAIVQTVAAKLGLEPERAKRIAAKIAGSTYGLYTTKVVHREDIRWGIRGMGPEMGVKWRFPKGQPEIEALFQDIRKYDPAGHPGDRLVAVYLANAKMLGRGQPVRSAARSRSVHEIA